MLRALNSVGRRNWPRVYEGRKGFSVPAVKRRARAEVRGQKSLLKWP